MSIIKPKIRTFMVTFPNSEAMFEFDRYLEDIVGMHDKMVGVPTVSAYDDGCINEIFPIKKRKTKEFLYAVGKYNLYAAVFSSKFVIHGLKEL